MAILPLLLFDEHKNVLANPQVQIEKPHREHKKNQMDLSHSVTVQFCHIFSPGFFFLCFISLFFV